MLAIFLLSHALFFYGSTKQRKLESVNKHGESWDILLLLSLAG